MKNNWSKREDWRLAASEKPEDVGAAVRIGIALLIWMGIFYAGVVWLILWTVRSSGYTDFNVTWNRLVAAGVAFSFVRALDRRLGA